MVKEHSLFTAGLIPICLAHVFQEPPSDEKIPRLGRKGHSFLPVKKLDRNLKERRTIKRTKEAKKTNRKSKRAEICDKNNNRNTGKQKPQQRKKRPRMKQVVSMKTKSQSTLPSTWFPQWPYAFGDQTTERGRYFSHLQATLLVCHNFKAMAYVCPQVFPYPSNTICYPSNVHSSAQNLRIPFFLSRLSTWTEEQLMSSHIGTAYWDQEVFCWLVKKTVMVKYASEQSWS